MSPKVKSTLGKRIRDIFFTVVDEEASIWKSQCGNTRKQSGSGHASLSSHAQTKHAAEF